MIKIAHFADIHIPNNINKHEEIDIIFEKTYKELIKLNPDIILIVGDLFHDFIKIENEAKVLAGKFLTNLAKIAPVRITRGNHDLRKKHLLRKDSVETVVELIRNDNIKYFNETGFIEELINDQQIVWSIWHHPDKIGPWKGKNITKSNNKIYIDLFHDPVVDCKLYTGVKYSKNGLPNISQFEGDYSMFGDIHLRQFFDNKRKAYPSSLFQQNFGEDPENHGFLLWSIENNKNFTVDEINIQNDYTFITFELNKPDYTNLHLSSNYITSNSYVRIIINDYPSNFTKENKDSIKKYIRDKFDCNIIKIEEHKILTDIKETEILNEAINIKDPNVQKDIFKEYLTLNKFDEKFINKILDIDNEITSRINTSNDVINVTWSIEKLILNNFKSYGDDNILDLFDKFGIIQINGKNQEGKSTILDGITYVLYNTTLLTNKLGGGKTEKAGDNRYINNKRDLDYCEGEIILKINEQKYLLKRRTERTFTKAKKLKSASTSLEIWKGVEKIEKNKLIGETKHETEEFINNVIGNFEDFIRIVLTNADNLNSLLSLNRATFIDSVIKDSGYDIYEKKYEDFKDYRKEKEKNNIKIDVDSKISKIELNNNLINDITESKSSLEESIKIEEDKLKTKEKEKDFKLKNLHTIDEKIYNIDLDELKNKLSLKGDEIKKLLNTKQENSDNLKTLKSEYDNDLLEIKYNELRKYNEDILDLKLKKSEIEKSISLKNSLNNSIENNIQNLKIQEINRITTDINNIEFKNKNLLNDINNLKNEKIAVLNHKINELNHKINECNLNIKNIKNNGINIKKEIKEIKDSTVCPTCGREYDNTNHSHLTTIINEKELKLSELFNKVAPLQNLINSYNNDIIMLNDNISELNNDNFEKYDDLKENILTLKTEITTNENIIKNYYYMIKDIESEKYVGILKEKIINEMQNKIENLEKIKNYKNGITNIEKDIRKIQKVKEEIERDIYNLEQEKSEVKKYETLINENEKITLKIENFKLNIENLKSLLEQYDKQHTHIEENKKIENEINILDNEIETLNNNITFYKDDIIENDKQIAIYENEIEDIRKDLLIVEKQQKQKEIFDEYQKCVHRNGIPTFLLKKSISLINNKLSSLLTNVDFSVFFDENLNLKMSPIDRVDIVQNALEGSGKERTFAACALKVALRSINQRSKPSFLLFDEMMGKLVDDSISEFLDFLETLKSEVNQILIIEHTHPINFDYLIEVNKDENGVSTLNIY